MSLAPTTTTLLPSAVPPVPTATAWLALLQEPDPVLQQHALQKLLDCVDSQWHEMAQALPDLEALAETASNTNANTAKTAQLAAAVASKVFFYLEEHPTALRLALAAGILLETPATTAATATNMSPYTFTLIRAALDAYILARQREAAGSSSSSDATMSTAGGGTTTTTTKNNEPLLLSVPQLQPLIYRLLESACEAGNYQHAVGIALEAREVLQLQSILQHAAQQQQQQQFQLLLLLPLLQYTVATAELSCPDKAFRGQAIQIVATHLQQLFCDQQSAAAANSSSKNATVCYDLVNVLQRLKDADKVAVVLATLLNNNNNTISEDAGLTALQLTFDLVDTGDQAFVKQVADALALLRNKEPSQAVLSDTATGGSDAGVNDATVDPQQQNSTDGGGGSDVWEAAFRVLTGGFGSDLALSFLHKQSGADSMTMDVLKRNLEERSSGSSRSSVLHNAAVVTHSYLYAGTTNDSFLRNHLDWMKKASNWYVYHQQQQQ